MAVSEPGQESQKPTDPERLVHNGNGLPVGDSAAGQSPGADAHVGSSPDGSQVSNPHSSTSYQWHADICSREAVDAPIVLDNDEPDNELDATTSDDDDDDDVIHSGNR